MQPVSEQRIGKHAWNNKDIFVNGVLNSVRAKIFIRKSYLGIGSRFPEFDMSS
jgi:hypothetical protein